jgi:ABC-2 type transport system ATP-binding protein
VTVVELRAVSRWYGQVLGLAGVELAVGPGITGLLGPNGAGKSTLMKLIYGELRPSAGEVLVFGRPPFADPEVAARLGLAPEGDNFYPRLRGRQFVELLLKLHGFDDREAVQTAAAALSQVGLGEAADRPVATYSKGMKQRLKLAQAIAHRPDVLILDEPLSGLDPVGRREVIDLIRREGARGAAVLVSSHILHEVELMTREVVLMSQGRVLATGNVHDIRRLIDAHPHRVRVATAAPRELAARLLQLSGILSVSFSEERHEVLAETADPEHFYARLAGLVLEESVPIEELDSPDDNLESVFHYLVGGG